MTKPTTISFLVAVLVSLTSTLAYAQRVPKGSVIEKPAAEDGTVDRIVVMEPSFLVVRDDLDYYNGLQDRHEALTTSLKNCEKQVTNLTVDPIKDPGDFWDSNWGTVIKYTALSAALTATFATGYAIGR